MAAIDTGCGAAEPKGGPLVQPQWLSGERAHPVQYDRDRVCNRPPRLASGRPPRCRFVRAAPVSCTLFPIRARHAFGVVVTLPSGANRLTPWGDSLHPPAARGANRSSAWALFPDSCAPFPIGALLRFGTERAFPLRHEPSREVGCHEPPRPRGRPFAGGCSVPVCAVFRLLSNSFSIPPKEILS